MTAPVPAASVRLVRPQDMLVIGFAFHNLRPDPGSDPPRLLRIDPESPGVVVVGFESQHVTEQTVYENEPDRPAPGSIAARTVGPSRIAFVVPETVKTIPYTETGLLRWWQWVMRVVPGAGRPAGPETDLLVVDWLHLTPELYATWDHAETPVEHDGRTELWHTRLAARGPTGRPAPLADPASPPAPTVRAVAADDPANPQEARLFGALNPEGFDYRQLITLTNPPEPDAAPVDAALLALSATGATLDLDGRWEPTVTPGLNLKHWEHHAWQGRDNKVILEQYGFLIPYGHRALLFTETKRTFDATTGVAYLEQRRFVRISEPVKEYPGAYGLPFGGRSLPFTRIAIEGPVPPVLPRSPEPLLAGRPEHGFWIQSVETGADVAFVLRGTDQAGRDQRFTAPLGFVPHDVAVQIPRPGTVLRELIDAYGGFDRITGDAPDSRRSVDLAGQELGYTAEVDPGTATHPTQRVFWGLQGPPGEPAPRPDSPLFFPRMLAAEARLSTLDAFYGPGAPVVLGYDERYLRDAFTGNPGEVYVRVRDSVASLASGEDRPVQRLLLNNSGIGGIWTPNLDCGGVSRAIGAVGGNAETVDRLRDEGEITGKSYFNIRDQLNRAVLFGATLLANVLPDNAGGTEFAPRIKKETLYPKNPSTGIPNTGKRPAGHRMTIEFTTPLVDAGPFRALVGNNRARLDLKILNEVSYAEGSNTNTASGKISLFELRLMTATPGLQFIGVVFKDFTFKFDHDGGPSFEPGVDAVRFYGPLSFVGVFQDYIGDAFKGVSIFGLKLKTYLEITYTEVRVGVTFGLEDIKMGPVLRVTNCVLSAGIVVPFEKKPVRAAFGFAREDEKFNITVYGFGGGGFLTIEVSEKRMEKIEGALEATYTLAFDFAQVATGLARIAIGVYFKLERGEDEDENSKDEVVLRGYVRATGRLSVLGLISITAEFYADLQYRELGGETAVTAHVRLTVSIDILFFHVSVALEFFYNLKGSISDQSLTGNRGARAVAAEEEPTSFGDLMSRQDWEQYCAAFAG
ncbi:hypothetical protein AB0G74_31365 [Streptomyces sp. NPDC020875]|uniref:hypothetical protein n=1 Tax=Streptomyces sp. NPDC020875 TaxID=3154898 RepID=UPI0033EE15F1